MVIISQIAMNCGNICMPINFRYYQEDAIESIFNYFKNNTGNPILALPTGTGKSLVIAGFIKWKLENNNIVIIEEKIDYISHLFYDTNGTYDKLKANYEIIDLYLD